MTLGDLLRWTRCPDCASLLLLEPSSPPLVRLLHNTSCPVYRRYERAGQVAQLPGAVVVDLDQVLIDFPRRPALGGTTKGTDHDDAA